MKWRWQDETWSHDWKIDFSCTKNWRKVAQVWWYVSVKDSSLLYSYFLNKFNLKITEIIFLMDCRRDKTENSKYIFYVVQKQVRDNIFFYIEKKERNGLSKVRICFMCGWGAREEFKYIYNIYDRYISIYIYHIII